MARSAKRTEVLAHIISVMSAANQRGEDGWKAVEREFPGIPADVVAEAWVEVSGAETEAWWQVVEKTIDGEIIRNALKAQQRPSFGAASCMGRGLMSAGFASHPRGATIIQADGSISFLAFPDVGNDCIKELLEVADSLPEDLCLFVNVDTLGVRVFQVGDALQPDGLDGFAIYRTRGNGLGQNLRSEILKTRGDKA